MDTSPISKQLLTGFMENFFGYGNLNSPYWFIGKEEGGGKELEENFRRIQTWKDLGRTSTVDMIEYHQKLGFTERQLSSIQPTWTKLAQILLELNEKPSEGKEDRRSYQRNLMGRINSNHCLLELMPMASRSTSLWLWKDVFEKYFNFADRNRYFAEISPNRRESLTRLIKQYKPNLVVFYSSQSDYIEQWNAISGVSNWNWEVMCDHFKFGWQEFEGTLFIITPHPTSHGLTNNDFPTVGKFIRSKLQGM